MTGITPVSERTLELFAVGELPAADAAELERRLREEPELAARLEALRVDDRAILGRHPAAAVCAEVRRRAGGAQATRRRRPLLLAAPALAAAALVVLLVRPGETGTEGARSGERAKGPGLHLVALQIRGERVEPVADGARVAPGDAIQLAYVAAGMTQGVIVSVDGRGGVTLHWPEAPGEPARLEPQGQVGLPHAFLLDDAPGFERFFFVAAHEPVSVARVLEAVRALGQAAASPERTLDLPPSWRQSSLLLRKDRP